MLLIDLDQMPEVRQMILQHGIDTPVKQAHFLAQVHHESNGLKSLVENLNYTPEALISTFGIKRISVQQANNVGRTRKRPADQEAIANIVYGGQFGRLNLGNTQTGDGWKYRGRGPIQCTGRRNYAAFGSVCKQDLIANPDLMMTDIFIGFWFAADYWTKRIGSIANLPWSAVTKHKINNRALNTGELITRRINGGVLGLQERRNLYNLYIKRL